MDRTYIIWFLICLIGYIIRTAIYTLGYKNIKIFRNKLVNIILSLSLIFIWVGWFPLSFIDPAKFEINGFARFLGLFLFSLGVSIYILSTTQLTIASNTLVRNGIYSKIRHPMYVSFIFWILGLPLFLNSPSTFISSILWIPFILIWRYVEEIDLEEKYPEYKDYKRNTLF